LKRSGNFVGTWIDVYTTKRTNMLRQKILDIPTQWDRFDRWATRFQSRSRSIALDLLEKEDVDTPDYLFLLRPTEYQGHVMPPHETDDLGELEVRAKEKISFLRGYFVDISFDGAEFMELKGSFLTQQYQSRCHAAMGFWFKQWEENPRAGAYHGFQGDEISLFALSPKDIDFESVDCVLPFDKIYIRQAGGVPWPELRAKEIKEEIMSDLGMNHRKFAEIDGIGTSMISITFDRDMP